MLYRRPLALCCIMFVLGTSVRTFGDEYQIIFFLSGVFIFGVCLLLPKKFLCVAAAFACFSAGVAVCHFHLTLIDKRVPEDAVLFSGEVRKINPSDENRFAEIRTEKINGISYTVRLYGFETECGFEENDIVSVTVAENGWRDPTAAMKADGVDAYCIGNAEVIQKDGATGFMPFVLRVRKQFTDKTKELFSDEPSRAAFLNAVLFGDGSGISSIDSARLRRTGTSHLICVSGLHFSIMMEAVIFVLSRLRLRYKIKTALCILFAAAYTFLVGLPVSAVRAALMCVMTFASHISLRKRDAITSLTVALALIVLFEPYAVYDIGAQFSFLSCAALIILSDAVGDLTLKASFEKRRFLKATLDHMLLPILFVLFAALFNSPVMLLNFDYFSVISPVSNLISSLLMPIIMATGAAASLIGSVIPFSGKIFSYASSALIGLFENIIAYLSNLKNACISTHIPGIRYISLIALGAIFVSLLIKKKRRGLCFLLCGTAFAVSVPIFAFAFAAANADQTTIFVAEGNDGSVTVCSENEVLWLDRGDNDAYADFVYLNGYSSVKYYIADCRDEKAYERFKRLASEIKIENAYFVSSAYADEMSAIIKEECGIRSFVIDESVNFSFGGSAVDLIATRDKNGKCVFDLRVTRKDRTYGSAGSELASELLSNRKADVIDISGYKADNEHFISGIVTDDAKVIEKNGKSRYSYKAKTAYKVIMSDKNEITVETTE